MLYPIQNLIECCRYPIYASPTERVLDVLDRMIENIDDASRTWAAKISRQTGQTWLYMKVAQVIFDKFKGSTLADLEHALDGHPFLPEFDR